MSTIVYSYGCRAPTHNAQVVSHQLWLASQYYNRCIDRMNGGRAAYRKIRSEHAPDVDRLEGEIAEIGANMEAAKGALKSARAASRKRIPASNEHRVLMDRLKEEKKAKKVQLKAAREAFVALLEPANEAFEALLEADYAAYEKVHGNPPGPNLVPEFKNKVREVMLAQEQWPEAWCQITKHQALLEKASYEDREHFSGLGLTSGTSGLVDRSVQQACKKAEGDPKRKPFTGEGRVGVQIQGGCSLEELFGGKGTYLQIDPVPEEELDRREYRGHTRVSGQRRERGKGRNSMARTQVRLRVGSEGRNPIWATWPVTLHRRLPKDARVQYAWVTTWREGPRWFQELQLTIRTERTRLFGEEPTAVAAVNLGWRLMDDGSLRVATLVDQSNSGKPEFLTLPAELVDRLGKRPEDLRRIRDTWFNAAKGMATRLRHMSTGFTDFLEATETVAQHKNPCRLELAVKNLSREFVGERRVLQLWEDWKMDRLPHGEDLMCPLEEFKIWLRKKLIFGEPMQMVIWLEWWRMKSEHLYSMECATRSRALRERRDLYRKWAYRVRGRFASIVIGKVDGRRLARKPQVEDEGEAKEPRHQRMLACVSSIQGALAHSFGAGLVTKPAVNITRRCHCCGKLCRWDQDKELVHTCEHCRVIWDQDVNACLNLLSSGEETAEDEGSLAA